MVKLKKQDCLILIEHSNSHLVRLKSTLIKANELNIKTVGIVPENCDKNLFIDVPFEVYKIPLLSFENIDNIVKNIVDEFNVIGINCPYG